MSIEEIIEQIVERKLDERLSQIEQQKESERLVRQIDLRHIYSVGMGTINRWVREGLNEYRDGRGVYYSLDEVTAFLKGTKYETRKKK